MSNPCHRSHGFCASYWYPGARGIFKCCSLVIPLGKHLRHSRREQEKGCPSLFSRNETVSKRIFAVPDTPPAGSKAANGELLLIR